jgi:hypothetical protein
MLIVVVIICIFKLIESRQNKIHGHFDSVSLFDNQPLSLGVYNLTDIEPVILKSA